MVDSREKLILKYIQDKDVLDLGVGDTSYRFLHKFLKKHARTLIGIELDKTRATKLEKEGYNIMIANVENMNLNKKFDVVVAGDLIEHLNNPGLFLDTVKNHMREKSIFICNTPNIYSINFILRGFFLGGNVKQFEEHTLGFNEDLLKELFRRHNLNIDKIIYFSHEEKKLASFFIRSMANISKKWHENILIIAKKQK